MKSFVHDTAAGYCRCGFWRCACPGSRQRLPAAPARQPEQDGGDQQTRGLLPTAATGSSLGHARPSRFQVQKGTDRSQLGGEARLQSSTRKVLEPELQHPCGTTSSELRSRSTRERKASSVRCVHQDCDLRPPPEPVKRTMPSAGRWQRSGTCRLSWRSTSPALRSMTSSLWQVRNPAFNSCTCFDCIACCSLTAQLGSVGGILCASKCHLGDPHHIFPPVEVRCAGHGAGVSAPYVWQLRSACALQTTARA